MLLHKCRLLHLLSAHRCHLPQRSLLSSLLPRQHLHATLAFPRALLSSTSSPSSTFFSPEEVHSSSDEALFAHLKRATFFLTDRTPLFPFIIEELMLRRMDQFSLPPTTTTSSIRSANPNSTSSTLTGSAFTNPQCVILLYAAQSLGDVNTANRVLLAMERNCAGNAARLPLSLSSSSAAAAQPEGLETSVELKFYNTVLNTYGNAKDWKGALNFFNTRLPVDRQLAMDSLNTLLTVLVNCEQARMALDIFQQLNASFPSSPSSPSSSTSSSGAPLTVDLSRLSQADRVPNLFTITIAISACGLLHKWEEAVALFNGLQKQGLVPNQYTYTSIMWACSKSNQFSKAESFFKQLVASDDSVCLPVYNTMLKICSSNGRWDAAVELIRQMQDANPPGARKARKEEKVPIPAPDAISYATAIVSCGSCSEWDLVEDLIRAMERRKFSLNKATYTKLILQCQAQNKLQKAEVYLARAMNKNIISSWPPRDEPVAGSRDLLRNNSP